MLNYPHLSDGELWWHEPNFSHTVQTEEQYCFVGLKVEWVHQIGKDSNVWVMGNVEDEYTLSTVNDMKLKLRNRLNEHMDCEDVWTIFVLVGYVSLQWRIHNMKEG